MTVKEYGKIVQKLKTYHEIVDYAFSLEGAEQKKFVKAFAKSGPYALQNIGYFSGYFSATMMKKIQNVFGTAHPIFGKKIPTMKEAYEAGIKLGEERRKKIK